MEKTYWIGRERAAMVNARAAACAESRLIHYELAGRYSIMAAQCAPSMAPAEAPTRRATLHLAVPGGPSASGGVS